MHFQVQTVSFRVCTFCEHEDSTWQLGIWRHLLPFGARLLFSSTVHTNGSKTRWCFFFHPISGNMIRFDLRIFFQIGGLKTPSVEKNWTPAAPQSTQLQGRWNLHLLAVRLDNKQQMKKTNAIALSWMSGSGEKNTIHQLLGGGFKYFLCSLPTWLYNIIQRGWNHQVD